MELSDDYKNIVKLRFNEPEKLGEEFFKAFYFGIKNPDSFNGEIFKTLPLDVILQYLKKSHTEYLTLWFPKIEALAKSLQTELGLNDLTMTLHSFIVNYYNELRNIIQNFFNELRNNIFLVQIFSRSSTKND